MNWQGAAAWLLAFRLSRALHQTIKHPWYTLLTITILVAILPGWETTTESHQSGPTTAAIHGTTTVSQTFRSPHLFLSQIDIEVSTAKIASPNTPVQLTLATYPGQKIVRQANITVSSENTSLQTLIFSFRPLLLSLGQNYILTISAPQATTANPLLAPYQIADDIYPDGNYFIKHNQKKGDLAFSLSAFRPLGYRYETTIQRWAGYILAAAVIIHSTSNLLRIYKRNETRQQRKPLKPFLLPLSALLIASGTLASIGVTSWGAGAFYDTAHDGLEAVEEVLQGNWQPFYEHYTGHQPLMDWVLATGFLIFGISATTLHIGGTLSAVATTLLLFLTGRALWSSRAGWYAGILGTTSHWLLIIMREGNRVALITPAMLLLILAITKIHTTKDKTIWWAATAGLALGSLGYIYASTWVLIPCAILALVILATQSTLRANLTQAHGFVLSLAIGIFLLLPLIYYAIDDPARILERPHTEVGAVTPASLLPRVFNNISPMAAGLLSPIPLQLNIWPENARLKAFNVPVAFPSPLIAPGISLIIGAAVIIQARTKQKFSRACWILLALLVICILPTMVTTGPQPHFRRTATAIPSLLLISGWACAVVDKKIQQKLPTFLWPWRGLFALLALYGPVMYFGYALPSTWYSSLYHPDDDITARYVFARVAAGQKVGLMGNTAHLKPFQFYALATPQAQQAFQTLPILNSKKFKPALLEHLDTVFVIDNMCAEMKLPSFQTPPVVIPGHLAIAGCIFDKLPVEANLRHKQVPLPASPPLLSAYRQKLPPLHSHDPFKGPIYTRW